MPFLSLFLVNFFYNALNFASVHKPRIFTFWVHYRKNLLISAVEGNGNTLQYSCLENPMDCSPPSSSPRNSPGRNTGVGSHSLLQGIFPNQGSNLGLPHCRWILYSLSHPLRIHLKSTFHIWWMGLLGLFLFFKKYFIILILF